MRVSIIRCHIQDHVSKAVYRPDSPDHSLLWLWAIHNVANSNLAGDPTEVTIIQHHFQLTHHV